MIELLVVIAIIAILASILLPALGRARDTAVKAVCQGRQQQQGLALNMYADDYDNFCPESPGTGHRNGFMQDMDATSVWRGDYRLLVAQGYASTTENLLCPGMRSASRGAWAGWFPYINQRVIGTWIPYGLSGYHYLGDIHYRWWFYNYTAAKRVFVRRGRDWSYPPWGYYRTWARAQLLTCPLDSLEQYTGGNPWGTLEAVQAQGIYRFELAGHVPGSPQGVNVLIGDGSVHWVQRKPGLFNIARGFGDMKAFETDAGLPY